MYTHVEFTFKQVVRQTKLFVFISNIIHQMECVLHLNSPSDIYPIEMRLRPLDWCYLIDFFYVIAPISGPKLCRTYVECTNKFPFHLFLFVKRTGWKR